MNIKKLLNAWRSDYNFKTYASSAASAVMGLAFTAYNGFLGIRYRSVWNGSICAYYILLTVIRAMSVHAGNSGARSPERVHRATHIMMLIMNVSLIAPIIAMIKGRRAYSWGLIPAIAIAAYTSYRIVMAVRHYVKSRSMDSKAVKQLRSSNLISALVAVLTLQNTMIIANGGSITGGLKALSIVSSAVIWLLIVALSVVAG